MADETTGLPDSGWYADPRVPRQLRWWDGSGWTNNVYMPDPGVVAPAASTMSSGLADQGENKWEWPQQ